MKPKLAPSLKKLLMQIKHKKNIKQPQSSTKNAESSKLETKTGSLNLHNKSD